MDLEFSAPLPKSFKDAVADPWLTLIINNRVWYVLDFVVYNYLLTGSPYC